MSEGTNTWYRNLRRSDRALEPADAMQLIDENCYGVLAMAWPDGSPYAVPINYGREGDVIYMHSATTGQKLDILRANPRAVLSVVEGGEITHGDLTCSASVTFRSALAFGKVTVVSEPALKLHGLRVLCLACKVPVPVEGTANAAHFSARANDTVVLALQVEHVSGKARA